MFNPKSEYALNKLDQDAIVCPSATGIHIRLTREDFDTEEEFRFWKDFLTAITVTRKPLDEAITIIVSR